MVRHLTIRSPTDNPTAAANARLGRESFRLARQDGHCKFSVRTKTRIRDTFPKHNGQARFHMVVKFVRFSLRRVEPRRPRTPVAGYRLIKYLADTFRTDRRCSYSESYQTRAAPVPTTGRGPGLMSRFSCGRL